MDLLSIYTDMWILVLSSKLLSFCCWGLCLAFGATWLGIRSLRNLCHWLINCTSRRWQSRCRWKIWIFCRFQGQGTDFFPLVCGCQVVLIGEFDDTTWKLFLIGQERWQRWDIELSIRMHYPLCSMHWLFSLENCWLLGLLTCVLAGGPPCLVERIWLEPGSCPPAVNNIFRESNWRHMVGDLFNMFSGCLWLFD